MPGEDSFTTALIWALKFLVEDRKRFTTLELQTKIMDAPNFPKNQFVPVGEGYEPCDQRLTLAPLPSNFDNESHASAVSGGLRAEQPQNSNDYYLDLRFWYPTKPDKTEIESLAKRFRRLMNEKSIGSHRIDWTALKNVAIARSESAEMDLIRPAAAKWKSLLRFGKTSSQTSPVINRDHVSPDRLSSMETPPRTPISMSNGSTNSFVFDKLTNKWNESTGKVIQMTGTMKEVDDDLEIRAEKEIESQLSHIKNEMSFANNVMYMNSGTQGSAFRDTQHVHLLLKIVALLSLIAYVWYAILCLPPTGFKAEL